MTIKYISPLEVGERLGLSANTIKSYYRMGLLPEPDAIVGNNKGWLPETIDRWNESRPGQGNHTRGENRRGGR